ncbi:MAG: 5-formyltetrahydrofolate cyclo-ligase [Victivallaceae bacterium]
MTKEQKNQFRKIYRLKRTAIPKTRRYEAEIGLLNFIKQNTSDPGYVMSFCSFGHEIPTTETNRFLAKNGVLLLPRIDIDNLLMKPIHIDNLNKLELSPFGNILQPLSNIPAYTDFDKINTILVPGLAFDPISKHRLGYGKGYYDRFLLNFPNPNTRIFGIGFKEQILISLPSEQHDISLSEILFF